jgi:hypothetical protein
MKTGINEIINEEDEADETMFKKRNIVRVNREAL